MVDFWSIFGQSLGRPMAQWSCKLLIFFVRSMSKPLKTIEVELTETYVEMVEKFGAYITHIH